MNKTTKQTIISEECDSGWYESGNKLRHNKYGKEDFFIGTKDMYNKDTKILTTYLYPIIETERDTYNIGFNIKNNGVELEIIPNRMKGVSNRRQKRINKYSEYRRGREEVKKEYTKKR